jgi:hypothetical protein
VMPRQAIYTLATREGELCKKEEIVRNYKGETKQQMIALIRSLFPLKEEDKRGEKIVENSIKQLERLHVTFRHAQPKISPKQKQKLLKLLDLLQSSIRTCLNNSRI